jgi:hypothetical protein
MTGIKTSSYKSLDSSALGDKLDLDSIDLFNIYYKKENDNEGKIQEMSSINSPLLQGFTSMEKSLGQPGFCGILKDFDTSFYNKYQSNCSYNKSQSFVGLANSLGYINNFLYNNYFTLKGDNVTISRLSIQKMTEYLSQPDLAVNIDNSVFLIDQAFISQLSSEFESISNNILNNFYAVISRNSVYLMILIFEFIFFAVLSNSLKDMINKDKAILSIIPSQAISRNEKIKGVFHNLKNLS